MVLSKNADWKGTEHLNNVDGRLAFLEKANKELHYNPPVTREEVKQLRQKLDNIENRERRNNLRFISFPEECEDAMLRRSSVILFQSYGKSTSQRNWRLRI